MKLQRQRSHPKGTFLVCRTCNAEPRHIVSGGGVSYGMSDGQACAHYSKELHSFECRCQNRTQKYPREFEAEREWNERFAVVLESAGVSQIKRSAAK